MSSREQLQQAKRIIVKVGTSTLNYATGKLNIEKIELLVRELSDLANQGREIILVSSGAVGAGLERMKKKRAAENHSGKAGSRRRGTGNFNAPLRKTVCRIRTDGGAGSFDEGKFPPVFPVHQFPQRTVDTSRDGCYTYYQ